MLAEISCKVTKKNMKEGGIQRSFVSRTRRVLSADFFWEANATRLLQGFMHTAPIPHLAFRSRC